MAVDFEYIKQNKIIIRCSTSAELESVLADAKCMGMEHFKLHPFARDFERGVFLRFFPVGDYRSNFGWDTNDRVYISRGCKIVPFGEIKHIDDFELDWIEVESMLKGCAT